MKLAQLLALGLGLYLSANSEAEEFGGIEFPDGIISFADVVVSYEPDFSGGAVPTSQFHLNPANALHAPDYAPNVGTVSLGSGGRITLQFTNNVLTGSDGADADLQVFEAGAGVEDTYVEISEDGILWHDIGKVFGATSSIDIDAFGFTSDHEFRFVRLTDDPNEGGTTGATVGADIDAVGAIATVPVPHSPQLFIEAAILVSFESASGSLYTIQESVDLLEWNDAISDIEGDGSVIKHFFDIAVPRKFYRLKPPAE
jgi:hypothetical protein